MELSHYASMTHGINTRTRLNNVAPNVEIFERKKKYELNIGKSLEKKLIAAKRVKSVNYEFTSGGIVCEADAATYELFKMAALHLYTSYPEQKGIVDIIKNTDTTGQNISIITIKVSNNNNQDRNYTLNLYNTTSRMLVNGKKIDIFIHDDLKKINGLIQEQLAMNDNSDIKSLNDLLKTELQNLMDKMNKSNYQNVETNPVKSTDINCIKCNRPCRSKASFCDVGQHWVHYNCEKLDVFEIQQLENDNSSVHQCKICLSQEIVISNIHPDLTRQTRHCPTKSTNSTALNSKSSNVQEKNDKSITLAMSILEEESMRSGADEMYACCVCNLLFNRDELNDEAEPMCFACVGTSDQIDVHEQTTPKSLILTQALPTKVVEDYAVKTLEPQTVEIPLTTGSVNESTEKNDKKASADMSSCNQHTGNGTHLEVKMSDLRQKELKLKKKEEDLKIREKAFQDNKERHIRLESYIKQLEFEKEEQEHTIRTLKRRIIALEENHNADINLSNNTNIRANSKETNNELIQNIHNRVTNYILKQVDKQVQKLECEEADDATQNVNKGSPVHKNPECTNINDEYRNFNVQNTDTFLQTAKTQSTEGNKRYDKMKPTDSNMYSTDPHFSNFQQDSFTDKIHVNKGQPVRINHSISQTQYPSWSHVEHNDIKNDYQIRTSNRFSNLSNQHVISFDVNKDSPVHTPYFHHIQPPPYSNHSKITGVVQNVNKGFPVHTVGPQTMYVPKHTLPFHLRGQNLVKIPVQSTTVSHSSKSSNNHQHVNQAVETIGINTDRKSRYHNNDRTTQLTNGKNDKHFLEKRQIQVDLK